MLWWGMRTTVDLPEDLHEIAKSIARDRSQTMSEAVVDLIRRGLGGTAAAPGMTAHPDTGFPTIGLGRSITTEDVRAAEDTE